MASLSAQDKEEIAAELDVISTWVQGPRRLKIQDLAKRIRGESEPEPDPGPEPQIPEEFGSESTAPKKKTTRKTSSKE